MEKINVVKGDIFHLKKSVNWIVYRAGNVDNIVFKKSPIGKSEYSVILPDIRLSEENAIEYLDYYKKAILKAKENKVKAIAIEAVDLYDDDLTLAFAVELNKLLTELLSVSYMQVEIVCKNKGLRDIYEFAIYNEIRSSLITMKDVLEDSEAIIVPTYRNIFNFDDEYAWIKNAEPKKAFYQCYLNPRLDPGKFFLVERLDHSGCYFFVNMRQDKKQRKKMSQSEFYKLCLEAIKDVLETVNTMKYKSVSVPLLDYTKYKQEELRDFMKKKKVHEINYKSSEAEDRKHITDIVDMCCEFAEEYGINIQFHCTSAPLWNYVVEYFENKEEGLNEKETSENI